MTASADQPESLLSWCFSPRRENPKHKNWKHATFTLMLITSLSFLVCHLLSNYFEKNSVYKNISIDYDTRVKWGVFFAVYYVLLFLARFTVEFSKIIYDMTWGCNVCITLTVYGLAFNKPLILGACLVAISCDQVLWYIDFITLIIFRKFKVGVASYLLWPEIPIATKITATHHLWFMPVLGYILKDVGGLHTESYLISLALTTTLWILSRATIPKTLPGEKDKDIYMNINLSWELWKDIKANWLRNYASGAGYFKTLLMSLCIWNGLNFVAYNILRAVINRFSISYITE